MTLGEQFRNACRELADSVRQIPAIIDRWTLRLHQPVDIAGDSTGPAICRCCETEWPCAEYVRVYERSGREG